MNAIAVGLSMIGLKVRIHSGCKASVYVYSRDARPGIAVGNPPDAGTRERDSRTRAGVCGEHCGSAALYRVSVQEPGAGEVYRGTILFGTAGRCADTTPHTQAVFDFYRST